MLGLWRVALHYVSWLDSVDLDAIPVQVVDLSPEGILEFPNLATARTIFPELNPYHSTSRFTLALRGDIDGAPTMRFETWAAYRFYTT